MLITPKRALAIILKNIRPLKATRRPLHEALGGCLAQDISADRDMPPADRSAVDGYAVRSGDLQACPRALRSAGEVAAGSSAAPRVRAGACVRILTGANVPPGADAVVMVEKTKEVDGSVIFMAPVRDGANIRRRGEEARKRVLLLPKGTILGPAQIGLCASVGVAEPKVYSRPRAAILCTGEELRQPGDRVRAHESRDSNGPALRAALSAFGLTALSHEILPDDVDTLADRLRREAETHDLVLVTGGVSVGKYDYVPQAVARIGAMVRFHGVRMKPGKPVLYATLSGNRHVFGLPGNPLSVMNSFYEFVLPAMRRLSGVPEKFCQRALHVPLARSLSSKSSRTEYVLSRLVWNSRGPSAEPIASHGSADLPSGGQAEGTVIVPQRASDLPAGTPVEFRPWRALP